MSSSDEQAANGTPGLVTGEPPTGAVSGSGNPYVSELLESSLIDLSTGGTIDQLLGSHQIRAHPDGRTGQPVIEGYDNLGPSRTSRSTLRLNCGLTFQVGDSPTATCDISAIHVLDDALMFVGRGGNLGPAPLADGVSYVLVAPPDLVVAIERRVTRNAANRRELAGFRVVLVNPVHREPLVIVTSGLDQSGLAMLMTAGETFMREQVGSAAGWRSLGDEWETMEWNGAAAPMPVAAPAPAPAPAPTPAAAPAPAPTLNANLPAAAVPSEGAAPAVALFAPPPESVAPTSAAAPPRTSPAAPQSFDDDWHAEPDKGESRPPFALIAMLALAVAIIGGVAWAVLNNGDDTVAGADSTTLPSTAADDTAVTAPVTTAAPTTTTQPETTTTDSSTTTEPEPTTTVSTGPAPVSESQQLSVWGFTQPVELDNPSGKAVCPAGEPTTKATVVGVGTALNVRDGADSSFQVVQRLALGYEDVDVYSEVTTVSAKGTTWVTVALAQPPGTAADADRACGWAAKNYLNDSGG